MNKLFVPFLPPWVETGLQPAFYDKESGTVLQQTARMYDKVNQLIRNFNELSDETKTTVEDYISQFNDLKDFVDDYFDNLDVQEEIDHKLDEMAEAGTLQEIIGEYLNATAVWGFDTVSDMVSSTNLINGSFAKTLGYYAKNDGGEGLYKIRNITNQDIPDGGKIIAMDDDTLVAELIIEDTVNVKQYGVYGDGTHDDYTNIQKCVDNCPNKTIFFPDSVYLVSAGIVTSSDNDKSVNLKLSNNAVIKASSLFDTDTAVINLGGKNYSNYYLYNEFASFGIEGGTIDCNEIAEGITIEHCVNGYIRNIYVNKTPSKGISLINGYNNGSLDCTLENVRVKCSNNTSAVGVYINSSDNWIENVRTYSGKYGFYLDSSAGGNHVTETHCLATSNDYTNLSNAQDMVAYYFKSGGGNYNYITRPYSDGFATVFYFDGNHYNYIRDAYAYYWKDTEDTNQHTVVKYTARCTGRIDGLHCRFPQDGTNTVLQVGNTSNIEGWIKELTIHNVANLNDTSDLAYDARFNKDNKKLEDASIENYQEGTTLAIASNTSTVCENIVNLNLTFSGLNFATNTNTASIHLPIDFRPTSNTDVLVRFKNKATAVKMIAYITSAGYLMLNAGENITGSSLQVIGSYPNR